MTHTDELRERVKALVDRSMTFGEGYAQGQVDMPWSRHLEMATNDIIAAVHASIAERALSDTVVEAVWTEAMDAASVAARNSSEVRSKLLVNATITALLTALGITESEAEV